MSLAETPLEQRVADLCDAVAYREKIEGGKDAIALVPQERVGHCRDCKWWESMPDFEGVSVCLNSGKGKMAFGSGEDGREQFFCHGDFGCIQFEKQILAEALPAE